eukprot:m.187192 g.187192  ORF g.187192 m.187192 type:complete len:1307 (-) comp14772_c0_seq1:542-4462(-)
MTERHKTPPPVKPRPSQVSLGQQQAQSTQSHRAPPPITPRRPSVGGSEPNTPVPGSSGRLTPRSPGARSPHFTSSTPQSPLKSPGGVHSARTSFRKKIKGSKTSLDKARREAQSYEYLCYLEATKQWLEATLDIQLPPPQLLCDDFCNGVVLYKLAAFFAPRKAPPLKVFDGNEEIYRRNGKTFRHADNIKRFLDAMASIQFPDLYFPTVPDIYDQKNIPKLVFCLHGLSIFLSKMGIASQIENLVGIAEFTDEQLKTISDKISESGAKILVPDTVRAMRVAESPTLDEPVEAICEESEREVRPYMIYWPFAPDPYEPWCSDDVEGTQSPNKVWPAASESVHDRLQELAEQQLEQLQDELFAEYELDSFTQELPQVHAQLLACRDMEDPDPLNEIEDEDEYRTAEEHWQQTKTNMFWDHMFWGTPFAYLVYWPFQVDDLQDEQSQKEKAELDWLTSKYNQVIAEQQLGLIEAMYGPEMLAIFRAQECSIDMVTRLVMSKFPTLRHQMSAILPITELELPFTTTRDSATGKVHPSFLLGSDSASEPDEKVEVEARPDSLRDAKEPKGNGRSGGISVPVEGDFVWFQHLNESPGTLEWDACWWSVPYLAWSQGGIPSLTVEDAPLDTTKQLLESLEMETDDLVELVNEAKMVFELPYVQPAVYSQVPTVVEAALIPEEPQSRLASYQSSRHSSMTESTPGFSRGVSRQGSSLINFTKAKPRTSKSSLTQSPPKPTPAPTDATTSSGSRGPNRSAARTSFTPSHAARIASEVRASQHTLQLTDTVTAEGITMLEVHADQADSTPVALIPTPDEQQVTVSTLLCDGTDSDEARTGAEQQTAHETVSLADDTSLQMETAASEAEPSQAEAGDVGDARDVSDIMPTPDEQFVDSERSERQAGGQGEVLAVNSVDVSADVLEQVKEAGGHVTEGETDSQTKAPEIQEDHEEASSDSSEEEAIVESTNADVSVPESPSILASAQDCRESSPDPAPDSLEQQSLSAQSGSPLPSPMPSPEALASTTGESSSDQDLVGAMSDDHHTDQEAKSCTAASAPLSSVADEVNEEDEKEDAECVRADPQIDSTVEKSDSFLPMGNLVAGTTSDTTCNGSTPDSFPVSSIGDHAPTTSTPTASPAQVIVKLERSAPSSQSRQVTRSTSPVATSIGRALSPTISFSCPVTPQSSRRRMRKLPATPSGVAPASASASSLASPLALSQQQQPQSQQSQSQLGGRRSTRTSISGASRPDFLAMRLDASPTLSSSAESLDLLGDCSGAAQTRKPPSPLGSSLSSSITSSRATTVEDLGQAEEGDEWL